MVYAPSDFKHELVRCKASYAFQYLYGTPSLVVSIPCFTYKSIATLTDPELEIVSLSGVVHSISRFSSVLYHALRPPTALDVCLQHNLLCAILARS